MKKLLSLICVGSAILFSSLITSCSTTTDLSELYPGQSPRQIFIEGKSNLKGHNFSEAIKHFEALEVQYPEYEEVKEAQLYLIYAYYKKEDYALSVSAADRYIHLYPGSPNVAYAYYMRGLSNYYQNIGLLERYFNIDLSSRDLAPIQKSFFDFKELETRFPHSIYTPNAHQYVIYLRNLLALHELHVAEYYYKRKAYVAAANRASDVVLHYQGAPSVVDALVIMAKSYHELKMTKQEQNTLSVLKYNYPDVQVEF